MTPPYSSFKRDMGYAKTLFQPTSPHIAKWAIVATIMKTVAIPFPQLRL
jgi:hypothetical protein